MDPFICLFLFSAGFSCVVTPVGRRENFPTYTCLSIFEIYRKYSLDHYHIIVFDTNNQYFILEKNMDNGAALLDNICSTM